MAFKRFFSLLICVCALAYAHADTIPVEQQAEPVSAAQKWLDPYPKHVGFGWGASADMMSNYIFRGLYVGGLSLQADVNVSYGGAFIDMWWNIGATDWTFRNTNQAIDCALNPEVDMTIGFSRWGLTVLFMHMYYFDRYSDNHFSRYFDFADPKDGVGGITQEWRIGYKVSSKLPLSILWCTRTFGRDGWNDADGTRHRAYSSYCELGYDFTLPWQLRLEARLGFTPWKSLYTGYQSEFAVTNVSAKLVRDWDAGKHLGVRAFAQIMVNPYDVAEASRKNTDYVSVNGNRQCLWNVGCGIYWK